MLAVAASRLGLKAHIFEPGANPPAGHVADQVTTASYDDEAALHRFAQSVDVITYEFENIPTSALDILEQIRPIHPGRRPWQYHKIASLRKNSSPGSASKWRPMPMSPPALKQKQLPSLSAPHPF
jgi:5-(carboxyamino)imidazole ribonucleotide synthase